MSRRLELHELLTDILGSRNVYFQPPESQRLSYPAIIYELDEVDTSFANGTIYNLAKRYSATVIDGDPDTLIFDKMLQLPMCRFNRHYKSDNLNHYTFNLYY